MLGELGKGYKIAMGALNGIFFYCEKNQFNFS